MSILVILPAVVLFLAWRLLVSYVRNDTFASGPRTPTAHQPGATRLRGIHFPPEAV